MRFAVEQWSVDYASPFDADAAQLGGVTGATVNEDVERPRRAWQPLRPAPEARGAGTVCFVDGVQRIDAWLWLSDGSAMGTSRPAICASYAAGAVFCDGKAAVIDVEVKRGLFTAASGAAAVETRHARWDPKSSSGESPELLKQAVQQRMGELEIAVAQRTQTADLIVIDGPLNGRQGIERAVGYIKTHHVRYLSDEAQSTVERLAPGERTPVFMMMTSWSRYSWYLRLPGGGEHVWAGVVRCEASADLSAPAVVEMADRAAVTLPRFASKEHKDPRAPQNLYPIAGLERDLRHRLGDQTLLYRSLRVSANAS
ncbi:MAG: hypothetical protein NVSMB57_04940 [Actinomycetota bacterium]